MSQIGAVVFILFLFSTIGYLVNQLPEIRDFPGRNWLLIRLLLYLTILSMVLQVLDNTTLSARVQSIYRYCGVAVSVAIAYEVSTALSVLSSGGIKSINSPSRKLRNLNRIAASLSNDL